MRSIVTLLTVIALLIPVAAFPTVPATQEQVLCGASHVVVATVLKATPRDCRNDAKWRSGEIAYCGPKDMANLLIRVTEVLGISERVASFPRDVGIKNGESVEVTTAVYNSLSWPRTEHMDRIGAVQPTSEPLSSAAISEIFEGKEFVFSIHIRLGAALVDGQVRKNALDIPPFYSGVWRLAKKEWVIEQLKAGDGKACLK